MQCPACNSASPDNVRFCLHCGQYVGEPTRAARVETPRAATTLFADFPPSPILQTQYEAPQPRRWPVVAAFALLGSVALIAIGAAGTLALMQMQRGEVRAQLGSPTPRGNPTVREGAASPRNDAPDLGVRYTPNPATPRPSAGTAPSPAVGLPWATPTIDTGPSFLGHEVVRVNWTGYLKDGQFVRWSLPPGYYQLELTSASDGATSLWIGAATWQGSERCEFASQAMFQMTQRCKMMNSGSLAIQNPTRFGLGAAVYATVRVTQF